MTTWPEPTAIRFDEYSFWVGLGDGCTLGIPLAWFPRLLHATPAQRDAASLSPSGLHWEEIDDDISIAGLLAGRGIRRCARNDVRHDAGDRHAAGDHGDTEQMPSSDAIARTL